MIVLQEPIEFLADHGYWAKGNKTLYRKSRRIASFADHSAGQGNRGQRNLPPVQFLCDSANVSRRRGFIECRRTSAADFVFGAKDL